MLHRVEQVKAQTLWILFVCNYIFRLDFNLLLFDLFFSWLILFFLGIFCLLCLCFSFLISFNFLFTSCSFIFFIFSFFTHHFLLHQASSLSFIDGYLLLDLCFALKFFDSRSQFAEIGELIGYSLIVIFPHKVQILLFLTFNKFLLVGWNVSNLILFLIPAKKQMLYTIWHLMFFNKWLFGILKLLFSGIVSFFE